jgi:uncharacterized protein YozE (UPF0346 family)
MLPMSDFGVIQQLAASDSRRNLDWPDNGQKFEIVMRVMASAEWELEQTIIDPPREVVEVMDQYGDINDVFEASKLPKLSGDYKMVIQFFQESAGTDWESGIEEFDCGFNILKVEKI